MWLFEEVQMLSFLHKRIHMFICLMPDVSCSLFWSIYFSLIIITQHINISTTTPCLNCIFPQMQKKVVTFFLLVNYLYCTPLIWTLLLKICLVTAVFTEKLGALIAPCLTPIAFLSVLWIHVAHVKALYAFFFSDGANKAFQSTVHPSHPHVTYSWLYQLAFFLRVPDVDAHARHIMSCFLLFMSMFTCENIQYRVMFVDGIKFTRWQHGSLCTMIMIVCVCVHVAHTHRSIFGLFETCPEADPCGRWRLA